MERLGVREAAGRVLRPGVPVYGSAGACGAGPGRRTRGMPQALRPARRPVPGRRAWPGDQCFGQVVSASWIVGKMVNTGLGLVKRKAGNRERT